MREIIFDTETTGLHPYPKDGLNADRIVEIGAIEIVDLKPTGRVFHKYINPERHIPQDAVNVHGIDDARVKDCPVFKDIVDEWLDFIGNDSTLVAHNASFDMGFINAELVACGKIAIPESRVVDTLEMARKRFPGQRNTLDALCKRFDISNDHRTLHGALLDSELLYDVYVELRGGRQQGFNLSADITASSSNPSPVHTPHNRPKRSFDVCEAELQAHKDFVRDSIADPLWEKHSLFKDD